ncbi:MAG: hypothetical protein WB795_09435 [Candidatus Acidiferrales bacterium]
MARAFIDNYFTNFVDAKGNINMRGPETAHYGLTLSLLARYFNYTTTLRCYANISPRSKQPPRC